MEEAFGDGRGSATILISHTHWDHVQGLPFFSPLYRAGNKIEIFARQRDTHLEAVFSQQHDSPYFPVPMSAMQADMGFHEIIEGAKFELPGGIRVSCTRLNHPWIAMAYRIDCDHASLVYCADTAPFTDILFGRDEFMTTPPSLDEPLPSAVQAELERMRAGVVSLAKKTDLLIYDTQFTYDEYRLRPHWGHSHPDDAIQIARDAGVKKLCLFHHAPMRSDDDNDRILEKYRAVVAANNDGMQIDSAYEGLEIPLGDQ
jgi:ribonuclease BN (tRNA processing enzyme)